MGKIPELREWIPLPDEIKSAASAGNLVLFVGAGISRMVGLPSWHGLAECVLTELRKQGGLNYSEFEKLRTLDPKKQLSIAAIIADQQELRIDISSHLTGANADAGIYRILNDLGCACVTTNYDELLSPRFRRTNDGSETAARANRVSEKEKFLAYLLDEPGTVVHLHGCVSKPETMVVTTTDYLQHYDNENVQYFLAELFKNKTILFLGYGLEEIEILEHIFRRGGLKRTPDRRHFSMQGFFRDEKPIYEGLFDYFGETFGVHLLGFIRDFDNYGTLESIIEKWVPDIDVQEPILSDDRNFMMEVLENE